MKEIILVVSKDKGLIKDLNEVLLDLPFRATLEHYQSSKVVLGRISFGAEVYQTRVKLLIIDDDLNGVSGRSLLEAIRGLGFALPVIFISKDSNVELEIAVRRLGVSFFASKPIDHQLFVKLLSRMLEHETAKLLKVLMR